MIKTVLLAKSKLNSIEVLISKALINLNATHFEFVSKNNMWKEYGDMKEEIKRLNDKYYYYLIFPPELTCCPK